MDSHMGIRWRMSRPSVLQSSAKIFKLVWIGWIRASEVKYQISMDQVTSDPEVSFCFENHQTKATMKMLLFIASYRYFRRATTGTEMIYPLLSWLQMGTMSLTKDTPTKQRSAPCWYLFDVVGETREKRNFDPLMEPNGLYRSTKTLLVERSVTVSRWNCPKVVSSKSKQTSMSWSQKLIVWQ